MSRCLNNLPKALLFHLNASAIMPKTGDLEFNTLIITKKYLK